MLYIKLNNIMKHFEAAKHIKDVKNFIHIIGA